MDKQVVDFSLNFAPKPGEGKVKASVWNETTLVPLKDFMQYEDGLFYNDEISIDNLKVTNAEGKDIKPEKNCMPYQQESIFHSDARFCHIKFGMADKGKAFKVSNEAWPNYIAFLEPAYKFSQAKIVLKKK